MSEWSGEEGLEQYLKVGWGNSSCCSIGKYHGLVVDASFDWKPAECVEEQGDIGELSVLDKSQGFNGTSSEPSQQRVSVVQMGDVKRLD